jgi:hypothetical protein
MLRLPPCGAPFAAVHRGLGTPLLAQHGQAVKHPVRQAENLTQDSLIEAVADGVVDRLVSGPKAAVGEFVEDV